MTQLKRSATPTYRNLLRDIFRDGREHVLTNRAHEARSIGTVELVGHQTRWDMATPAIACPARKLGYRFLAAEPAWIMRGSNRLAEILPYAKHLATFSDDGVHLNGSYGPPFVEQLPYVVQALKDDPSTRQAVATFWRPRPGKWKDVPCTIALQWLLRVEPVQVFGSESPVAKVLHCVATMRSSDVWLGVPYDVATFSALSAFVALTLRQVGARVDRLGDLILTAGSQHLYSRDRDAALACLQCETPDLFVARPLDLDEFADGASLHDHLRDLADRRSPRHRWLSETHTG